MRRALVRPSKSDARRDAAPDNRTIRLLLSSAPSGDIQMARVLLNPNGGETRRDASEIRISVTGPSVVRPWRVIGLTIEEVNPSEAHGRPRTSSWTHSIGRDEAP